MTVRPWEMDDLTLGELILVRALAKVTEEPGG
jgi:hypothetical protein